MSENKNTYKIIQSVRQSAEIIKCLNEGVDKISDLSKILKISLGTTHRILKSLELEGFVVQQHNSLRYNLGPIFDKICTNPIYLHQNLIISATEEMKRLWEISRETVALFLLIGRHRILLKEIQSEHVLRFVMESNPILIYPDPGGIGKTLLSLVDTVTLDNILSSEVSSIESKEDIRSEIVNIREQGYFLGAKELLAGGVSISAAIYNYTYPAVITIAGPESRILPKASLYIRETRKSAIWISNSIKD